MDTSIVIKVKYGETLRRFNAMVFGNEQLEFDMEALRMKILDLFNLSSDADLTFTYTDVDDDVVTLVDNNDLCDVMKQRLNPFRINVTVKNNDGGGRSSFTRPSGNSTPMRLPGVQQQYPNLPTGVAEVLGSVPKPFGEAIAKITIDATSKAASSAPQIAELVEMISKMGQSFLFPGAQSQDGADRTQLFTPDTESLKGGGIPAVVPNSTFADTSYKGSQNMPANVNNVKASSNVPNVENNKVLGEGSNGCNSGIPGKVDCSGPFPPSACPFSAMRMADDLDIAPLVYPRMRPFKKTHKHHVGVGGIIHNVKASSNVPNVENNKVLGEGNNGCNSGIPGKVDCSGPFPPSACPFSAMCMADDLDIAPLIYPRMHPFKKSHKHHVGVGGIIHSGVICDGCEANPITGPRFKSKVKDNYDLCNICFARMGNKADYIRIDRPVSYRHSRSKGLYNHVSHLRACPALPYVFKGGIKVPIPKLDSRFILDVNVMDGTILAPSTPFSKIWRMRNNGSLVWAQGTQLVWIGGDKFSDAVSVEIEVPAHGLTLEEEVNVDVDFIAPDQPGRYISYWKMASPSGQKFGQRIWVLIQVDASLTDSVCDTYHDLNLNLPPVNIGSEEQVTTDEPMIDCGFTNLPNSNTAAGPVEPFAEQQPSNSHEENFPINDSLLVGAVAEPVSLTISYPVIDTSMPTAPALSRAVSEQDNNDNSMVEQTLLKELEEMGFKQVDLNKEILRLNEYDMEQSLDDLCGVAEWDPILKELNEMGFYDRAKNKQLLAKNNGSLKRVVMDLIAGEK